MRVDKKTKLLPIEFIDPSHNSAHSFWTSSFVDKKIRSEVLVQSVLLYD